MEAPHSPDPTLQALIDKRVGLVQGLAQNLVNRATQSGMSLQDVAINALIQAKVTEAMLAGLLEHLAVVSKTPSPIIEDLLDTISLDERINQSLATRVEASAQPVTPAILVPGGKLNGHG